MMIQKNVQKAVGMYHLATANNSHNELTIRPKRHCVNSLLWNSVGN